jgi:hypothetical protein
MSNCKYGGDISRLKDLGYILSVGYEVECGILMKLTKSDADVDDSSDAIILFNSDTARKDILEFKKFEENPEDIDEDIIARLEEMVEDKMYDDNGEIDHNSVFHITNDIAMSPFIKKLKSVCYYPSEDKIKSLSKTHSVSKSKALDNDDNDDADHSEEKNNLYLFRDTEGQDYEIHFLFEDPSTDCATHSNVEWVFTYYKPQQNENIIVNTFLNMIKNLLRHLSDLTPITGNFIVKYKDVNDEEQELIIEKPEERVLYHKPDTNLYYLLTQMYDAPFTIDDACSVFQMTFSSKGEHIINVMIALLTDTLKTIPKFEAYINSKLDILLSVKKCVDDLVENYNTTETVYKFIPKNHKSKIRIEIIKNYLCLILLKIERYFEFKNSDTHAKYLKNFLFFNSRHSNYVLYTNLRKKVEKMFGIDRATAVGIIKKMIFQSVILQQIVPADIRLRKGIFSISNVLEKSNRNYGDPNYSLVSYFDFFENPVDDESNRGVNSGNIINYDWLEYKAIDDFSTKMDLVNDVVLIECRIFQKILSSYVYSIADEELKQQMTNGSCNILTNKFGSDVSSLSIANLKKILQLHGGVGSGKKSRSRSKAWKTRKVTHSKQKYTKHMSKKHRHRHRQR